MKILHIGPDSGFTRYLGEKFEAAAPGSNIFVTISSASVQKHAVPGAVNIVAKPNIADFLRKVLPAAVGADAIVAHGMTSYSALLMAAVKKPIKIWSGWGYDYCTRGGFGNEGLLGPLTAQYATGQRARDRTSWFRRRLSGALSGIRSRAARSAHYFSAPIPTDFDVMLDAFPEFTGAYLQLNYGDVESMFSIGMVPNDGINVLVGNSSSLTNNHDDVFSRIADCDLTGRRVIVPLSYGDPRYREFVIKRGTYYFGERFSPLLDFMPLDEYAGIISSCNIVLMGHRRQQALGNIGAAIFQGANVYLDGCCPTYKFLAQRGVGILTLDQIERSLPLNRTVNGTLARNRKALEAFWGESRVMENVADCLARIASNHPAHESGI